MSGLGARDVQTRLARYGPNTLERRPPPSAWSVLRAQFRSVVLLLLLGVFALALILGDHAEAAAIGVVVALNVSIGFWSEWRARLAMDALLRLQVHEATVIREGRETRVDARDVVPGDLIVLEGGSAVPADARVVSHAELRANEAPLTGESAPVTKSSEPGADELAVADQTSMVFKGTLIVGGTGVAIVTGTGTHTQIGRISELVQTIEDQPTPMERRLDALGRRLIWATTGVVVLVTAFGVVRGRDLWLMVRTGVALAIAAIPEGLPVVATVTLAVGMRRMARRNALVRQLPAVEALGAATVVCADKTGTLTRGEMTVTTVALGSRTVALSGTSVPPEGEFLDESGPVDPAAAPALSRLLSAAALANRAALTRTPDGWDAVGDPTEVALLAAAAKAGIHRPELVAANPEVGEIPFSSARKWMATLHERPAGGLRICVKGAPGIVLGHCDEWLGPDGPHPLDDVAREAIEGTFHDLAGRALRVLAVADRTTETAPRTDEEVLTSLTFLGFLGLADPPAPLVRETLSRMHRAGIRTVMITGDHPETAMAIAREIGIGNHTEAVTGRDMAALDPAALVERAGRAATFARVTPEEKVTIVELLQGQGDIVAMLGDGVNDAPALRRADVGVAMGGRGTDVAKETADLVLQDDRFETLGAAVELGRVIYDNIRKFIFYLFSCNVAEVAILGISALSNLPLALLPLQILWLNLVTDVFPALALAGEPPEPDVMDRPPRPPEAALLSLRFSTTILGYAGVLTAITVGTYLWALLGWQLDPTEARTLAFMALAFSQLAHVFNARSFGPLTLSRLFRNRWVWGALVLTIGLQLSTLWVGTLRSALDLRPPSARGWALVVLVSTIPLVVGQTWKYARRALGSRGQFVPSPART